MPFIVSDVRVQVLTKLISFFVTYISRERYFCDQVMMRVITMRFGAEKQNTSHSPNS